jgi:hypothetical protein
MDIASVVRETGGMFEPGRLRQRLARILGAAFAEGLLSEETLSYRLALVFEPRVIEPQGVVGDLTLRGNAPRRRRALAAAAAVRAGVRQIIGGGRPETARYVLALDCRARQTSS